MNKALAYKDVYLPPNYSILESRSHAEVSARLGKHKFKLPVMPSNMVACIDEKLAEHLSFNGYFYVMHRFWKDGKSNVDFVKQANKMNWPVISVSIGVKEDDYRFIRELYIESLRCDFVTIDIAHGHSILMRNMLDYINDMFHDRPNERPYIIAGNVTTPEAVSSLMEWGADAAKVGIGGGGACSTKNKTGFHIPMFTAIKDCCDTTKQIRWDFQRFKDNGGRIPIIADGGIRENGDITKALVAGADWVMAGSLFTACIDSPAENVYEQSKTYHTEFGIRTEQGPVTHKRYFGSASARNKGAKKHVEGFEVDLPCNGMTIEEKLQEIKEDLQSSVSYAGGVDLAALKRVKFVTV